MVLEFNKVKSGNRSIIVIYISVSPTPKFYFCGWFDKKHIKRILFDFLDSAAGKSEELRFPLHGPLRHTLPHKLESRDNRQNAGSV